MGALRLGGDDDRIIRATESLMTRIKMVEFLDLSHTSRSAHFHTEVFVQKNLFVNLLSSEPACK